MPAYHVERFALEQIEQDRHTTVLLNAKKGEAIAVVYFEDGEVEETFFYRDSPEERFNFEALAWHIDLFWGSGSSGRRWTDFPVHVKLAHRLAELAPDTNIASIIEKDLSKT